MKKNGAINPRKPRRAPRHSETEEISNAENEATPHPNTETKNREEEIRREKNVRQSEEKCGIEVGTKRGNS